MKNIFWIILVLFTVLSASYADDIGGTNLSAEASPPIESFFSAYGLGNITRMKVDPDHPDNGHATIQMLENIGQEKGTNQFEVAISSFTAAPIFPNPNRFAPNEPPYLPLAQWMVEFEKPYFVQICRRTNDYFLTSIDFVARWDEKQGRKAYLASGQFEEDKKQAYALIEEIDSIRHEISRLTAKFESLEISDEDYQNRMAPLEKRENELNAEYQEVWARVGSVHILK